MGMKGGEDTPSKLLDSEKSHGRYFLYFSATRMLFSLIMVCDSCILDGSFGITVKDNDGVDSLLFYKDFIYLLDDDAFVCRLESYLVVLSFLLIVNNT